MALQTSGAISLNDIHIELGGTSGTTVSLNDTDVRGLVSISSGAIDLADFYGASAQAFSTTTIGITEGDDLIQRALLRISITQQHRLIDTTATGVTISGKSHTLYAAFRRQNASSYQPISGTSSFWMYFNNASDGTVAPVDFFTDIDVIFDGYTVNLDLPPVHTRQALVVQDDETGVGSQMTFPASDCFTHSKIMSMDGTFDLRINA